MRQAKRSLSFPLAALRGVCVGFAVIAVIFAVLSVLVSVGKLSADLMQVAALGSAAVGAVTGGVVGATAFGAKKLIIGTVVGAAMLLLSLLISAFSEFSAFPNARHLLLTAALLGGGILGGVFAAGHKKPRKH
ncbi:MAG: TIGR04086 family membrane protein [Oscillospiraceae bacterium]|jgi:putative membrane protein (TIGR04086 family)|nr:TIGR04086 family membrane protein [Oscillospiraceae bacterium]